MTVCSYHVTYTFQSEYTFYICLNVKELLARNRRNIWSLSDCNRTRTHNHLVRKQTLSHLVSWPNHWSVWPNGWVFIYKLCGCGFESHCSHLHIYSVTAESQPFDIWSKDIMATHKSQIWKKISRGSWKFTHFARIFSRGPWI